MKQALKLPTTVVKKLGCDRIGRSDGSVALQRSLVALMSSFTGEHIPNQKGQRRVKNQDQRFCGEQQEFRREVFISRHAPHSQKTTPAHKFLFRSFASTGMVDKQCDIPQSDIKDEGSRSSPVGKHRNFKVEATYVGSSIDIYKLLNLPSYKDAFKTVHKDAALISLSPLALEPRKDNLSERLPFGPYMAVTSYGAAVFFDADHIMKEKCLATISEVVHDAVAERKYNEEFTISVQPNLASWSQLEPECILLRTMDLKNLQVVAQVLAQSVALDYYSNHVERTLETFCSLNQEMTETANISKLNKQVLLQLVAENNIVMTEIISKLGLHERYDIAWKDARYGNIWDFLRAELEVENRFETLDMKLNLIQDNLKYFLEILQNRKSDTLEWIIIILIGLEILLSLYEIQYSWAHDLVKSI